MNIIILYKTYIFILTFAKRSPKHGNSFVIKLENNRNYGTIISVIEVMISL